MQTKKIIATANEKNRTHTLRAYDERGKLVAKYRTLPTNKQEFELEKHNTSNDWIIFLRTDTNYYKI